MTTTNNPCIKMDQNLPITTNGVSDMTYWALSLSAKVNDSREKCMLLNGAVSVKPLSNGHNIINSQHNYIRICWESMLRLFDHPSQHTMLRGVETCWDEFDFVLNFVSASSQHFFCSHNFEAVWHTLSTPLNIVLSPRSHTSIVEYFVEATWYGMVSTSLNMTQQNV